MFGLPGPSDLLLHGLSRSRNRALSALPRIQMWSRLSYSGTIAIEVRVQSVCSGGRCSAGVYGPSADVLVFWCISILTLRVVGLLLLSIGGGFPALFRTWLCLQCPVRALLFTATVLWAGDWVSSLEYQRLGIASHLLALRALLKRYTRQLSSLLAHRACLEVCGRPPLNRFTWDSSSL